MYRYYDPLGQTFSHPRSTCPKNLGGTGGKTKSIDINVRKPQKILFVLPYGQIRGG